MSEPYRLGKKNDGKWYARFKATGKKQRGACLADWNFDHDRREPQSKAEARQAQVHFEAACRSGKIDLAENPDRKMSVQGFCAYYTANFFDRTPHVDAASTHSAINTIGRFFGPRPVAVLENPATIIQFHTWLTTTPITVVKKFKGGRLEPVATARKRSTATIDSYRKLLRRMCAFAKAFDIIDKNPFEDDRIKKFMWQAADTEGRKRGVTAAEYAALVSACDKLPIAGEPMKERLHIAYTYGCRRGEMLRAQLEDIDFTEWTWTFPATKLVDGELVHNTKDGETRIVPIAPEDKALFRAKREANIDPKQFIFGNDGHYIADFKTSWAEIKRLARLDDATLTKQGKMHLHWHDLRGEAGTRMLREGYSAEIVSKILGNTPAVLRAHYEGEMLDAMRNAVTAVTEKKRGVK